MKGRESGGEEAALDLKGEEAALCTRRVATALFLCCYSLQRVSVVMVNVCLEFLGRKTWVRVLLLVKNTRTHTLLLIYHPPMCNETANDKQIIIVAW